MAKQAATRRPRRRMMGAATALTSIATLAIASPTPAAATTTTTTTTIRATGATITRTDAPAGTTLTVKASVARLDLWCTANKLVVNTKATSVPCDRLVSVTTTGLIGNAIAINATG